MQCIGRHCQAVDSSQNLCELCILDHPSDLIRYPDFGSNETQHTEAIRQWCTDQNETCSLDPQANVCNGADCAYTKAVYCHSWCLPEECGNECSRCILSHRTRGNDILRFYIGDWDVSCAAVDAIVVNWRALNPDPCESCRLDGVCYDKCIQKAP